MSRLRNIEQRVKGQWHGPIVRLVSPADLGERLKPFVFLDFLNANTAPQVAALKLGRLLNVA